MSDGIAIAEQGGSPHSSFLRGMWDMFPLAVGAAPFGLMVGALAAQADLGQWDILMMSSLVFAGASQFTALDMWATPVPALSIIGVTLLVNLRHVLMGAAVAPHIRHLPTWCRWSFLYVMSDESWAMVLRSAAKRKLNAAYVLGVILPFYLNWLLWSVLGVTFGQVVKDPETYGFDFVFTAVFITLVMGFWRGWKSAPSLAASAVTAWVAHRYLPGVWYIFLGGVAGVVAGAIAYKEEADHVK